MWQWCGGGPGDQPRPRCEREKPTAAAHTHTHPARPRPGLQYTPVAPYSALPQAMYCDPPKADCSKAPQAEAQRLRDMAPVLASVKSSPHLQGLPQWIRMAVETQRRALHVERMIGYLGMSDSLTGL